MKGHQVVISCEGSKMPNCNSHKAMAFVIPFLVMTVSALTCKHQPVMIATTIGFLAGASGFILYSSIKAVLRTIRTTRTTQSFEVEPQKVAETCQ